MAITTERLTVNGPDGQFQAYFAAPQQNNSVPDDPVPDDPAPDDPAPGDPVPGVIVIQEIFGVNSHIRSVTERLAQAGFAALAPDIFWRIEHGIELGYNADDVAKGRELKSKMNMDEVISDVSATFDALTTRPECNQKQKPGIVGFCYGGLISYVAAARLNPACASSYYGGGIVDYLNEADKINAPIQFHFGSEDNAIPLDQVEQVRQIMADKADTGVFVYQGAGHGFHCEQRGSYNAASAAVAWDRTLKLFAQHLA